jgi:hypothetical protein
MSEFKKFNASENRNYNSGDAYENGTLTWDSSNGLRLHDGSTSGGNPLVPQSSGSEPMPHARSPLNINDPDVSLAGLRVMMSSGVVRVLSAYGQSMGLLYTGRIISAADQTQTIVSSNGVSVDAGQQHTIGTLVNRGDTLILDSIYDANSNNVYRVTAMITWSSVPYGVAIIEQLV